jgi:hypothetical protein
VAPRPEVLTLAETADYLRVSEEAALKSVRSEGLPGRLVDGEWRFLRTAVEDWLRGTVQRGSKEAIRTLAGAWKDDPDLDEIVKEAYRQRGRPMTENGE